MSQEEEMILREQMNSLSHHDISLSLDNEDTEDENCHIPDPGEVIVIGTN